MRHILLSGVLAALAPLALAPGAAMAQPKCLEGRTATGQCINTGLAEALRQAGILFSQPKLSQTHYPVLPNERMIPTDPYRPTDDRFYRYPNQLNPDPLKPSAVGTPVPPPPPP